MKIQTSFNRHSGKRSASRRSYAQGRILKRIDPGQARMTILIFVFFLLGISIVLLTQKTTAQEKVQQQFDVACYVQDVPTLKSCMEKAKRNEVDLIKITKIVQCLSKEDCEVDLSNRQTPLTIYGIENTNTGFQRSGNFDYTLFTFKNTKDVSLGSFLIEDSSGTDCGENGALCPPAIVIENAQNMTVDQLRTKGVKNTAVFVKGSQNVLIKQSVFENSQLFGVDIENGNTFSKDIAILTNTFVDSASHAVFFQAGDGTNTIKNNIFIHNHKDALYVACQGFCLGAQVRVMPGTKNLSVHGNKIRNGKIDDYDAFGLYASGIEIASENVERVTLACNQIEDNKGNGIVIANQSSSTNGILIEKNTFFHNGIDLNVLETGNTIRNNCFNGSCQVSGC